MIPLRDNIPSRTFPFVNYGIIAVTCLVFVAQLGEQGMGKETIVEKYGMIPVRIRNPNQVIEIQREVLVANEFGELRQMVVHEVIPPTPFTPWITLITCIFLHGGWLHFLSNMWFLHIFGDNCEDCFGHFGYFIFYMICGMGASIAHLIFNLDSAIPTIGASGAIAGVMGAYMLLYPRAMVLAVIPLVVFFYVMPLPAPWFLGIWFLMQFFQGAASIVSTDSTGVAWWAHIGGFIIGFIAAGQLKRFHRIQQPVSIIYPNTEKMIPYRYRRNWNR